jgi:hypothetical protein
MKKKIYINGIGSISAQLFDPRAVNFELTLPETNRLHAVEPDYKEMLPPMQLRRMSKVVKLGVAAAKSALRDAGIEKPDIITTGTAYGCLADTENFLQKMITQEETLLTPTAFIQSTHNTVSGQIALLLSCHGHNFTYVQRGHSFESSLQESMLWLAENDDLNILTGGIDEMTQHSFEIISRFGTYKNEHNHYSTPSEGCIAGEGANLFILNPQKTDRTYAELSDLKMCYTEQVAESLQQFLEANNLKAAEIDTCLTGTNGDVRYDDAILKNTESLTNARLIDFKKWSGEFPTSGAFAMALAAGLLLNKHVPAELIMNEKSNEYEPCNVLIYNHYKNQYHSFILLRSL